LIKGHSRVEELHTAIHISKAKIMEEVQLELDTKNHGEFFIAADGKQVGEMKIGISGNALTAFHTEVLPEAEGKGLAKKLFGAMVDYSRKNHLKVIAYCPFVLAQFRRHPEEYADIWKNKS
jgi:predicted GNAT family acetyltransferase